MKNNSIDLISNIMLKLYFDRNLYHLFFQVQEKLEACQNSNLKNYRRQSFGDDINVNLYLNKQYLEF